MVGAMISRFLTVFINFFHNLTFTNFSFFCLLLLTFILYYSVPLLARKYVLLLVSIAFYATWGIPQFAFVAVAAVTVYCGAILFEKIESKSKKKFILFAAVSILVLMLLYVKLGKLFFESKSIIVPLGISYYTFSVIGYLADVYWEKDKAEKNFLNFLLYILFFPHILQGPIPRHSRLASQLVEGHPFDYQNFCFGLQRVVWGLFKKLVIADRFGALTGHVFGNYMDYEGQVYVFANLCSMAVMYCDFSGCMDVAIGVSEALGIKLDENFCRPLYSRTAGEFWRRWHITLGTWFTDYVFMPIMTPGFVKLCGKTRKILGKRFSKSLLMIIPLAVVWLLTGLWHGTGLNYLVWGAYWYVLILVENLFAPEFKKLAKFLKINTDSPWYHRFQIFRTILLFFISRLITGLGNIKVTGHVLKSMLTVWNPWIWFDKTLFNLGLDAPNLWCGVIAILILWKMSSLQEKGIHIRERIASYPLPARWVIYLGAVFSVLIFGWYGPGFDASNFIYMQF